MIGKPSCSHFKERPVFVVLWIEVLIDRAEFQSLETQVVHAIIELFHVVWLTRIDRRPAFHFVRIEFAVIGDDLIRNPDSDCLCLATEDDHPVGRLRDSQWVSGFES